MTKSDTLNIFVHIPKTAGERIKQNIIDSLPKNSFIHASHSYYVPYYDINRKKQDFYKSENDFLEYMHSLSEKQKRNIRCIGGHDSYYGIHNYFKKTPRYMVFFREPVSRTLSLYNYERTISKRYAEYKGSFNISQEKALERIQNHFLVNGREPSFEEWLMDAYDKKIPFYYSMTKFLQQIRFLPDTINERTIKEAIQKFSFIGITEKYEQDALFLYHELGVKKFGSDAHISTSYIHLNSLDSKIVEKIKELNASDILLYQMALQESSTFKTSNTYFQKTVKKMQWKQKLYFVRRAIKTQVKTTFNVFWTSLKSILKKVPLCVYLNSKIKHIKRMS